MGLPFERRKLHTSTLTGSEVRAQKVVYRYVSTVFGAPDRTIPKRLLDFSTRNKNCNDDFFIESRVAW